VKWGYDAPSDCFQLQTDAPAGTTGAVSVPLLGQARSISEDGQAVWDGAQPSAGVSASSDGTYVSFPGATGSHLWAWCGLSANVPEAPWAPALPLAALAVGVAARRLRFGTTSTNSSALQV
jgi:hypothetical protein